MNVENEAYLGDGVYATYDPYGGITLDLRGQDITTRIVMEPEVIVVLFKFNERMKDGFEKQMRAKFGL